MEHKLQIMARANDRCGHIAGKRFVTKAKPCKQHLGRRTCHHWLMRGNAYKWGL